MNMLTRQHTFVPGHFIRRYTWNYYLSKDNCEKRKKTTTSVVRRKRHTLILIALYVTTVLCNRLGNSITLLKSLLHMKKRFHFITLKTTGISKLQGKWVHYA